MKIIKRASLKNLENKPKYLMFLFCSIHYVLKRNIIYLLNKNMPTPRTVTETLMVVRDR